MARRARNELPDGVYHVTCRGVGGIAIFHDDEDRATFAAQLENVLARFHFHLVCHGYSLLGTHYHLLLEGSREQLSLAMHRLNGSYARAFNDRHGRRGHLFEERFSAYVVRDEAHLEETLRYLSANPVRAGLCATEDAWPWTWLAAAQAS